MEKQDIPQDSFNHLQTKLLRRLNAENDKNPTETKKRAIELSQNPEEVWNSLMRLKELMKNVPTLFHLLDIFTVQQNKPVGISEQKIKENLENCRNQLKKIGVDIEYHAGEKRGFDANFKLDQASTNNAKVKKEGKRWKILTNDLSQDSAFELAHEVYGNVFKRTVESTSDQTDAGARSFLDVRVADALFSQASNPLFAKLLFQENSPFEKIHSKVGHLQFF